MTQKAEGTGSRVKSHPLLEALISRRSCRFAKGMTLNGGPFRTVLAHQAHRLDVDFYERFYKPQALPAAQGLHADDQS